MARSLFWLSDEAWSAIEPDLPKNQLGARRVDDRRVISGIVHMLKCGGRWADCPAEEGLATTVYNQERPHSSLGYETPAAFVAELDKQWPASLRHAASAAQPIASTALGATK